MYNATRVEQWNVNVTLHPKHNPFQWNKKQAQQK